MVSRFAGVERMVGRSWTSGASVAAGEVDRNLMGRKLYDGAAVSEIVVGKGLDGDRNAVGVVVMQEEGFQRERPKWSGLEAAGPKYDGRVPGEEEQSHLGCSGEAAEVGV